MTEGTPSRLRRLLNKIKDSGKTKDFPVFLVFVGIAAIFWYILSLNDEAQNSYDVELRIVDVPDTVTFISPIPSKIHVSVRDKGLNFMRHQIAGVPKLDLRFEEHAEDGFFRLTHSSLLSSVRKVFGSTATVVSVSPDSLKLVYTTYPGVRIPLELDYDVTVASGMVLGTPKLSTPLVSVYSTMKSDTLRKIKTEKVVLRNLDRTTTIDVKVNPLPGKKISPDVVQVTFPVESLVKKESEVPVEADNIPLGHDILFFPSKVRVAYYVPMSRYADTETPIKIEASFNEAFNTSSDKVGIRIVSKAPYMSNVELLQDSVEYTVVKSN